MQSVPARYNGAKCRHDSVLPLPRGGHRHERKRHGDHCSRQLRDDLRRVPLKFSSNWGGAVDVLQPGLYGGHVQFWGADWHRGLHGVSRWPILEYGHFF
jgi:hypothetical protein